MPLGCGGNWHVALVVFLYVAHRSQKYIEHIGAPGRLGRTGRTLSSSMAHAAPIKLDVRENGQGSARQPLPAVGALERQSLNIMGGMCLVFGLLLEAGGADALRSANNEGRLIYLVLCFPLATAALCGLRVAFHGPTRLEFAREWRNWHVHAFIGFMSMVDATYTLATHRFFTLFTQPALPMFQLACTVAMRAYILRVRYSLIQRAILRALVCIAAWKLYVMLDNTLLGNWLYLYATAMCVLSAAALAVAAVCAEAHIAASLLAQRLPTGAGTPAPANADAQTSPIIERAVVFNMLIGVYAFAFNVAFLVLVKKRPVVSSLAIAAELLRARPTACLVVFAGVFAATMAFAVLLLSANAAFATATSAFGKACRFLAIPSVQRMHPQSLTVHVVGCILASAAIRYHGDPLVPDLPVRHGLLKWHVRAVGLAFVAATVSATVLGIGTA